MSQIVPMITLALKAHLTAIMQTAIDPSDLSYAHVVKVERYQEDPTKNNVQIAIAGGDPDNPDYVDGIVTLEDLHNIGFNVYAREIGGGQMWWRRGHVMVGAYFILEGLAEEAAQESAYTILGRLEDNIENLSVSHLVDDYGEQAIKLFMFGNEFFRSGGPPSNYMYRGKVLWQCLTERP